jgi:opacity protein-like surface antigen
LTQRFVVAIAALGALASPALAADASLAPLPTFAQNPPAEPPAVNPWSGMYVGSEIFGVSGRGVKGGVGGGGFFGLDRAVGDNFFVGVRGSAGYSPSVWSFGPANGFDFATMSFRAGYEEGRWKTYVMGDIGLAKLNSVGVPGVPNAGDSINNLFNGGSRVKPLTAVGAGVDYAITENLTVGVSVSAVQSRGFFVGPPPP